MTTQPTAAPRAPGQQGDRRARTGPLRWSTVDEARLLAGVLTGTRVPELAASLGRSGSAVSYHLRLRGWPTPTEVRSRPGLADQLRIVLVRQAPSPPVVREHRRRHLDNARSLTVRGLARLTAADRVDLMALPPAARIRQWARLVGLPVHDRAPVPAIVAEAYARHAPEQVQQHADPATERHAARRWARQTGMRPGTRGRLPPGLLPAFRAAGSPGLAEAVAAASQVHVRSDRSGGPVVTDPEGLRHRVVHIAGPALATACGLHVDRQWRHEPQLTWAKAGALLCTTCREDTA